MKSLLISLLTKPIDISAEMSTVEELCNQMGLEALNVINLPTENKYALIFKNDTRLMIDHVKDAQYQYIVSVRGKVYHRPIFKSYNRLLTLKYLKKYLPKITVKF